MGYAVIQACDGGEAVDLHERERPHLVLIDLMMRYQELYAAIDTLLVKGERQAASAANPFHRTP